MININQVPIRQEEYLSGIIAGKNYRVHNFRPGNKLFLLMAAVFAQLSELFTAFCEKNVDKVYDLLIKAIVQL